MKSLEFSSFRSIHRIVNPSSLGTGIIIIDHAYVYTIQRHGLQNCKTWMHQSPFGASGSNWTTTDVCLMKLGSRWSSFQALKMTREANLNTADDQSWRVSAFRQLYSLPWYDPCPVDAFALVYSVHFLVLRKRTIQLKDMLFVGSKASKDCRWYVQMVEGRMI